MIVIETTSEIQEVHEHDVTGVESHRHFVTWNHGKSYLQSLTHFMIYRQKAVTYFLVSHLKCSKTYGNQLLTNGIINQGYIKLKPLLYPCTIEFSLMSLTVNSYD